VETIGEWVECGASGPSDVARYLRASVPGPSPSPDGARAQRMTPGCISSTSIPQL